MRRIEDAPVPALCALIAIGLGAWFLNVWIDETAIVVIVRVIGLGVAIVSFGILRRRNRPPSGPPSGFA